MIPPLFISILIFLDTVAGTLGDTKNAAESTTETGKSYFDSAKGKECHSIDISYCSKRVDRSGTNQRHFHFT